MKSKLPYITKETNAEMTLIYIKLTNSKIHKTMEYNPYLIIDKDIDDNIVGVEIIHFEEKWNTVHFINIVTHPFWIVAIDQIS